MKNVSTHPGYGTRLTVLNYAKLHFNYFNYCDIFCPLGGNIGEEMVWERLSMWGGWERD